MPLDDFAWVKGTPGVFDSSEPAERGFCRDCGTPLFFRYLDRDRISVSLGSLDDPARVAPTRQYGLESRLAFLATLTTLPGIAHRGRGAPGAHGTVQKPAASGDRPGQTPDDRCNFSVAVEVGV